MIQTEQLFRLLADGTRLRCLMLLHRVDECCVCDLTHALELSQPKISRHLAQLRNAGLVQDRREGLWVHYRLAPDLPDWVLNILQATAEHVDGLPTYQHDLERFRASLCSKGDCPLPIEEKPA